jgi:hypothetical protein
MVTALLFYRSASGAGLQRLTPMRVNLRRALLFALVLLPASLLCETEAGTVPAGTPLAVTIDQNYPMQAGAAISGHLLYPIYVDNKLLLPKGTVVNGEVVTLRSDHSRRVRAVLGGDFTPFHLPEVHFTRIVLADGTAIAFSSDAAANGAPIYRAVAPPTAKGGFVRREFDSGVSSVRSDIAVFTAPGKVDRLVQFVYGRLPYHPQRIEHGTSWTVETSAPVDLPAQPAPPVTAEQPAERKPRIWEERAAPAAPANNNGAWIVQANLEDSISSESSSKGQAIHAVVAEPIYNADHMLAVPQGATLVGAVTRAKPARRFGRTGDLSFSFSQLTFPNAETQTVETRLTGADTAEQIALNSEGQAQSKPQDKLAVPFILAMMATRPLDRDCGHRGGCNGNSAGKNGIGGAAGLGLVGTVVGLAGGSPYAAAGIGYWGAGRAFYYRWIARGQKIAFTKDTRIMVETTPRRSAPMKPNAQP